MCTELHLPLECLYTARVHTSVSSPCMPHAFARCTQDRHEGRVGEGRGKAYARMAREETELISL
eukprot:COSAG05_NODE_1023_length_6126_cov_6.196117_4_plen_64_part_00